ncbi:hypothetical protein FBQ99_14770 [Chloroflexi bacterium CFX2]|nr:hypothetical protein [Chloroflexi bacterium CFX2]
MGKTKPAAQSKTWLQENAQKISALIFWALLIAAYQWYATTNQLSPLQVVQQMLAFMQNGVWGVLIWECFIPVETILETGKKAVEIWLVL